MYRLITTANHKTVKGEKQGYLTGILYLAPGNIADPAFNACPHASAGCTAACLYKAGRGMFSNVQHARVRKTRELIADTSEFIRRLCNDITWLTQKAARKGLTPVFRLNGTSDISWETVRYGQIPQRFPALQFYDYSKSIRRVLNPRRPTNYHLTFSRSENNDTQCLRALECGANVAAVFDVVPVGEKLWGYKIIDGDNDDLRFLHKKPVIVGVKAKGPARKEMTGFVIREQRT